MATMYANVKTITDGVVYALDAANPKSATSGSAIWWNLAGNGSNSLLNGATYSTERGGAITFDGINDAAPSAGGNGTITIGSAFTISVWLRHTTLPSTVQRYVTLSSEKGVLRHDGANSNGQLDFYIVTTNGDEHIRVNNSLVLNQVYNIVGTWNGTIMRLYKQTTQIGSLTPVGAYTGGNVFVSISSAAEAFGGSVYNVTVYNRALSAAEIVTNYNFSKARYGV